MNSHEELANICREVRAFDSETELGQSLELLRQITGSGTVEVGVKEVLLGVETARQSAQGRRAEKFADVMGGLIAGGR